MMTRYGLTLLVYASLVGAVPDLANAVPELAGAWSGRMEPGSYSAEIELKLQSPLASTAAGVWTAELLFHAGADNAVLPVDQLNVEGGQVRFHTQIEGAELAVALTLTDGLLLGTVEVREGTRVIAQGPAGLVREGDQGAEQRLILWFAERGASIGDAQKQAVVARAAELFSANYVFEEKAQWAAEAACRAVASGEFNNLPTAASFADHLSRILAEATGDRHVRVKYSTQTYPDPLTEEDPASTAAQHEEMRQAAMAEDYGIGKYKLLDGNIGYLPLTSFFPADIAGGALATAMVKLNAADAMIIDLRECRGGDPDMVALVASWLYPPPARHWHDMHRRFDHHHRQYWTASWLPGPRFVDKPVYVLTAQRTFSAPEGLAYELQQTKRATIVGEITGGGAHPGAWFPLGDGFALFIPLSHYVSPVSGTDWEGVGVIPDVPCPADEALDQARELILLSSRNSEQ